jgi:cation-transporting P-type ATPase C
MVKDGTSSIRVCHFVPGRLRVQIPSVRKLKKSLPELEARLNCLSGIRRAEVRQPSGSIILLYDSKQTSPDRLVDIIRANLADISGALSDDCASPVRIEDMQISTNGSSSRTLRYHLLNVVGLGGFLTFALVRRLLGSPLSARPLSVTSVVATVGTFPLLYRAFKDLRERKKMGLLPFLTVGCGLAIGLGEALTALEIIWLLSVGFLLEEHVGEKARKAIKEILQVIPEKGFILINGMAVETLVSEIKPGDVVAVRTGGKIPADGSVLDGEALVDEAHITGGSQPALRRTGDWVYAGTRVDEGELQICAEKVGEETYLCKIRHMVDESLGKRAEVEKKADVLANRLTTFGLVSTFATLVLTGSLTRSFSVMLVMSCPCATVLAASTAIAAAMANAARHHILVKGGVYLEQVKSVDCYCFDKTGTITSGRSGVAAVIPRAPWQDTNQILALAASAEARSNHPLALALINEVRERKLPFKEGSDAQVILGRGVRARVGPDEVLVGSDLFMDSEGVDTSHFKSRAKEYLESGHTLLFVARNGKPQGMVAVANTLRPGAATVLNRLRSGHAIRLSLISGDTESIVKPMAETLGFDEYRAGILPEEKALYVETLEKSDKRVLMLGDGVNDALALSKASVGVAMGAGGSEVAMEAADIALLGNDLQSLLVLRLLSEKTIETIERNFWIATATNVLGVVMGGLGFLPPLMTGALHVGHTLFILANSGRLLIWEAPEAALS